MGIEARGLLGVEALRLNYEAKDTRHEVVAIPALQTYSK